VSSTKCGPAIAMSALGTSRLAARSPEVRFWAIGKPAAMTDLDAKHPRRRQMAERNDSSRAHDWQKRRLSCRQFGVGANYPHPLLGA
jgi:hypothetical protein